MDMAIPNIDLDSMSVQERLALIERIWASLSKDHSAIPLTPEQEAELDRRADELDAGQTDGLTWKEAADQIRNRRT